MKCPKCNTENKDVAVFCANCGCKLDAADASQMEPMKDDEKTTIIDVKAVANEENAEPIAPNKPEAADTSEKNTTVLTNNMAINPDEPVPFNPAPPMGFNAPQGAPVPPQGMPGAPMGKPMPPKGMPGAPMGKPMPPQGMPGAPMGKPMPPQQKAPKQKAPKQKAPKQKGKMGTGCKVYIIISIVLMLAMGGAIGYGIFYFNGKLDDKKDELKKTEKELQSKTNEYDVAVSDLSSAYDNINNLNQQLEDANDNIQNYQNSLNQMQESQEGYQAYDALIGFSENYEAQGSAEFMCSDTILTISSGETVPVYIFITDGGMLSARTDNNSVASVKFDNKRINEENRVTSLFISGKSEGNTIVTVRDDYTGDEIKIFVTVK